MGRSTTKKDMGAHTVKPSLQEAMQMGIAAAEKGERDEAHRIFKETAELHPDVSDVWVWLGGTSTQLDEAEQAFEKARALDPANEKASLGLRWVQLRKTSAAEPAFTGTAVPAPPSPVWDQVLQTQPEAASTVESPQQGVETPAQNAVEVTDIPAQPDTLSPIWERQATEAESNTTTTSSTMPAETPPSGGWLSSNLRLAILLVLVVVLAVFVFLLIR